MRAWLISAAALIAVATPGFAAERTGYLSIAAGNLKKAESVLDAERRADPDSPEVMLNLAAIYQQTGRAADARSLYAAVLAEPDVSLDLASGETLSAHQVAHRGLTRLTPTMVATR